MLPAAILSSIESAYVMSNPFPSKPSIVFLAQKPFYSQPNYSSWWLGFLCVFLLTNLVNRVPRYKHKQRSGWDSLGILLFVFMVSVFVFTVSPCLSVCLSDWLTDCLWIFLFLSVCLSFTCLSLFFSMCVWVFLILVLIACLWTRLCLSVSLSVSRCVRLLVCLSVSPRLCNSKDTEC